MNAQSPNEEIPQTDGPADTPVAASHESKRDIPQKDGPVDTPVAHESQRVDGDTVVHDLVSDAEIEAGDEDNSTDGSDEQSLSTGTDDVKECVFKAYEEWEIQDIMDNQDNFLCCECGEKGCPNICLMCPVFPTTWCSKEHKCVSAQSQLAAFSMDVTDIPHVVTAA